MRNPRIELKSRLNIITKGILLSSLALTGACFTASAEEANKQKIKEKGVERITISAGKKVGITKTEDLVMVVPSLDIKQANGQGNINVALRGLGLNDASSTSGNNIGQGIPAL